MPAVREAYRAVEQIGRKFGPDSQHAIKGRSERFIHQHTELTGHRKNSDPETGPKNLGIIAFRAKTIIAQALSTEDHKLKPDELPPLSTLLPEQRQQIAEATRENMKTHLYDESGERVVRSKAYVKEHLEEISANIYAATVTELGFEEVHSVQLLAELAMFEGNFVQLRTGEGKTVCNGSTAMLFAVMGEGVHVVTPNQYLAEEGAKRIGKVASALGLEVGLIADTSKDNKERNTDDSERQIQFAFNTQTQQFDPLKKRSEAYSLDITYGTDDEFQFDFIKDRTVTNPDQYRQVRGQKYAIIDELDQILLDKATSDHIISNPYSQEQLVKIGTQLYSEQALSAMFAVVVDQLEEGKDYTVDESSGEIKLIDAAEEVAKRVKEREALTPKWINFLLGKEPPRPEDTILTLPSVGLEKFQTLLRRSDLIPGQREPLLETDQQFYGNTPEQTDAVANVLQIYLLNAIHAKSMEKLEETHGVRINPETQIGEIALQDPYTRRFKETSRYTEGLHQAIEARQQLLAAKGQGALVEIKPDRGILTATATSSYFKRYTEITGSSGSLIVRENLDNPEQLDYPPAAELHLTYGKDIIEIPPHTDPRLTVNPEVRVYPTIEEKLQEIVFEIATKYGYNEDNPDEDPQLHQRVRPILVGLYDKAQMEQLRDMLSESFVPIFNEQHPDSPIHIQLLSAEDTQEEGRIIANAGIPNTITIASIAGRGTDIVLGGERPQDLALIGERPLDDRRPQTPQQWQQLHDEATELGGLYAIGEPGVNQRISIQFAGRPREIGEWLEVASWQDYFMRKAYGPKGADALAKATEGLPLNTKESRNIIDKAQTLNANRDARLRMETLRDYETIDAQFDAFYRDRDTIVRAEGMERIVHDLARNYIRTLLINDQRGSQSALFAPLEQDSAVPNTYMTGEEVSDFTKRVYTAVWITEASMNTNPADKAFAQEIFQLASKSTRRELIDLTTEKIADRFHALYEQQNALQVKAGHEARTYVRSLGIPENERQEAAAFIDQLLLDGNYPSFDQFAHEATLITADARMGNHYSQLLSLRTSIMRIRALQDRFPADTFRQEAGQLYRGFKQQMQESVLKTLFLSQNYINYAGAHVAKQALEMTRQQV